MFYIKKNGEPVVTNDPTEVTKENFLVEPGAEDRVWVKLEQYEYDRLTGEKKTIRNQINAVVPGDFDKFARQWKHEGITMTMLHDPRPSMKGEGVAEKLEKLRAKMKGIGNENENENQNENGGELSPVSGPKANGKKSGK